jgi:hypothetical protein
MDLTSFPAFWEIMGPAAIAGKRATQSGCRHCLSGDSTDNTYLDYLISVMTQQRPSHRRRLHDRGLDRQRGRAAMGIAPVLRVDDPRLGAARL